MKEHIHVMLRISDAKLHQKIKIRAAIEKITLCSLIERALKAYLKKPVSHDV